MYLTLIDEKETIRQEVRLLVQEGGIGEDCSGEFLLGQKQMKSQELPLVPLSLVLEATQHFCKENKLGEGGFGPVYKASFIAVLIYVCVKLLQILLGPT